MELVERRQGSSLGEVVVCEHGLKVGEVKAKAALGVDAKVEEAARDDVVEVPYWAVILEGHTAVK